MAVNALAAEYGVTRLTIWRWRTEGDKHLLPDLEDRETWRQMLTATLTERIAAVSTAETPDDRALVALSDRLVKMLGLDHSDKMSEAALRIEAKKLDMLAQAMALALTDADVDQDTRFAIGQALDARIAELESA